MNCENKELDEARIRIHSMLQEITDGDKTLHQRIDGLWKALLISVVVGAVVMSGLVIHVAGDYFRFDELHQLVAEIKIDVSKFHDETYHKR